jgi:hypothetical protein
VVLVASESEVEVESDVAVAVAVAAGGDGLQRNWSQRSDRSTCAAMRHATARVGPVSRPHPRRQSFVCVTGAVHEGPTQQPVGCLRHVSGIIGSLPEEC